MTRELSTHEIRALHHELLWRDILAMAEKLPPFPDVVWKVMSLIRTTAPVSEIEAVIKYDPAITAKVLALSRSAYYGRKHDVSSLQDAILVLGGHRLVQVILTASAYRFFQGTSKQTSERDLWRHSVSVAVLSEMVARRLKYNKVLVSYTGGLLHDIGKTVLDWHARIYLGCSLSQLGKKGIPSIEAERNALSIDHQELGETIARRWKLPADIVTVIGCHHNPEKANGDQVIAAIVYVADMMVTAMESGDEAFDPESDLIFRKLGISYALSGEFQHNLTEAMNGIQLVLTGE